MVISTSASTPVVHRLEDPIPREVGVAGRLRPSGQDLDGLGQEVESEFNLPSGDMPEYVADLLAWCQADALLSPTSMKGPADSPWVSEDEEETYNAVVNGRLLWARLWRWG